MTEPTEANSKLARASWLRALARTAGLAAAGTTLPEHLVEMAERFGEAQALLSREAQLSYRELAAQIHRYARWGLERGLRRADTVGLLMTNQAEYLAIWLGLSRIGVAVALINTNLSGDSLAHSIASVAPVGLIVGAESAGRLAAIRGRLEPDTFVRMHLGAAQPCGEDFAPLASEVRLFDGAPLAAAECAPVPLACTALYIYTSGTTGLPKAAKVSHLRVMQWSQWFAGLIDASAGDRMFNCLPLYHSVGGVVANGAALLGGGAVVIRERFSASDFWRDVHQHRCTLFQYIGELCRYLLNAPPHPLETSHTLRLACGNGLRREVWEAFQRRFRIPRILEYYASTEGNFSLYNCEGEPGAIGKIPSFLAHRLPVALLRVDMQRGAPLRNAAGWCERCATDEVGEAVGLIAAGSGASGGVFEGYSDPKESARKVLHDVFERGDTWYRTGDLMRRDARGFFYFVDRIGDSYRWKGENVSTAEVWSALADVEGVLDGVIYGVQVPGTEGRAGMAALLVDAHFDLATFRQAARDALPAYARPLFVRLLRHMETTGTFKPRKQELAACGFDPALTGDPLYFDDPCTGSYLPLDAALYARLCAGEVRL